MPRFHVKMTLEIDAIVESCDHETVARSICNSIGDTLRLMNADNQSRPSTVETHGTILPLKGQSDPPAPPVN
jgi:hypothetical protein